MNTTCFWRSVWKEYRQQRALWFAVLVLAAVLQLVFLMIQLLKQTPALRPEGAFDLAAGLFSIAMAAPVLYMLGCGAILFAGERENETFPFLQALPISSSRLFAAKVTYAALSLSALMPAVWLTAWAMSKGALPEVDLHIKLWLGGLVACLEVFVWATLFSLIWHQVLPAAAAAGATAGATAAFVMATTSAFARRNLFDEFWTTIPFRLSILLLVGAVVTYVGRRCLSDHVFAQRGPRPGALSLGSRIAASFTVPSSIRSFSHLVWLELRQSWLLLSVLLLGYALLSLVTWADTEVTWMTWLPALASLSGACVFWSDKQRSRFRYFAEHGINPHWLWTSRMLVWGGSLAVVSILAVITFRLTRHYNAPIAAEWLGLVVLTFAAGQLGTTFTRSGIVGVFVGLIATLLVGAWAGLVHALAAPMWLALAPLPFVFLFATWLHAPAWIAEHAGWRVRLRTSASLAVPLIAIWLATSAYRGYEVPLSALPMDVSEIRRGDTPEARTTWQMYEEAEALLKNSPASSADETINARLTADRQQGLQLFLDASARPACRSPDMLALALSGFDGRALGQAVLDAAQRLDEQGELDRSLELRFAILAFAGHLYQQPQTVYQLLGTELEHSVGESLTVWAAHKPQETTRIRAALSKLAQWQQAVHPRFEIGIVGDRELSLQFARMSSQAWQQYYGMEHEQFVFLRLLTWLLPWEQQRAERVVDALATQQIHDVHVVERALANNGVLKLNQATSLPSISERGTAESRVQLATWRRTTFQVPILTTDALATRNLYDHETLRRVVRLQLALLAWRAEHGELPQTLQELIGHGLDVMPLDPYTGTPFHFHREGFPIYEDSAEGMAGMSSEFLGVPEEEPKVIGHEPPFLWSPGANLHYSEVTGQYPHKVNVSDFRRGNLPITYDQELWTSGIRFPLPMSSESAPEN